MDRRDFIKSMGVAGGVASGLSAFSGAFEAGSAGAARAADGVGHAAEGVGRAAESVGHAAEGVGHAAERAADAAGAGSIARSSMLGLLDTIRQVQAHYLSPEMGVTDPDTIAEGERAIAHLLETGLTFWLEADPERPVFMPYVTPTRKLLGDNPDSVYYFAPIRDDRRYLVRGNVGAATFTSFTIEAGSAEGHAAKRSVSALGDDEMEIAPDGGFEITVSVAKPEKGNWLELGEGASQITTRHYHESRYPIAASGAPGVRLHIEPLDPPPLAAYGGDARVASHLDWVANFVREHAAMEMTPTPPEMAKRLGWVSIEPNVFTAPGRWVSASGDMAYGNTHAYYASAPYALGPDEALVIRGRFPDCRFANVVLWNRYMQSYDYANRRISLNRRQIDYEDDGSFRLVVAHENPGVPNWLDTEGRPSGTIYWRYVFPVEKPRRVTTDVVKLSRLRRG